MKREQPNTIRKLRLRRAQPKQAFALLGQGEVETARTLALGELEMFTDRNAIEGNTLLGYS
jgi:hypothetical protein